jgi:hypothetical protein
MKKTTATTIAGYNTLYSGETKKLCTLLRAEIDKVLPKTKATSKLWHGSPVWFIDNNPVAGYSVRKVGVTVLFWSGQTFTHPGLSKEGSFKAAEIKYLSVDDVKLTNLRKWLKECKTVQWDYKNIIKNKGKLNRI